MSYTELLDDFLAGMERYWSFLWEAKAGILLRHVRDHIEFTLETGENIRSVLELAMTCSDTPPTGYAPSKVSMDWEDGEVRFRVFISLEGICYLFQYLIESWIFSKFESNVESTDSVSIAPRDLYMIFLSLLHFHISHELYHARFLLPLYQHELENVLRSFLPCDLGDKQIRELAKISLNIIHDLFANNAALYDVKRMLGFAPTQKHNKIYFHMIKTLKNIYLFPESVKRYCLHDAGPTSGFYYVCSVISSELIGKESMVRIAQLAEKFKVGGFVIALRHALEGVKRSLLGTSEPEKLCSNLREVMNLLTVWPSMPHHEGDAESMEELPEIEYFEEMEGDAPLSATSILSSYLNKAHVMKRLDYKRRPRKYHVIVSEFRIKNLLMPRRAPSRKSSVIGAYLLPPPLLGISEEHEEDIEYVEAVLQLHLETLLAELIDSIRKFRPKFAVKYPVDFGGFRLKAFELMPSNVSNLHDLIDKLVEEVITNAKKISEIDTHSLRKVKEEIRNDLSHYNLLVYIGSGAYLEELDVLLNSHKAVNLVLSPTDVGATNLYFTNFNPINKRVEIWEFR